VLIDRSALDAQKAAAGAGPRAGSVSTWAMLICRVYEVDPLECPKCGGAMKIISFIERGQQDAMERILRHCGLWEGPVRTLNRLESAQVRGNAGRIQLESHDPIRFPPTAGITLAEAGQGRTEIAARNGFLNDWND
jgi:hypothetical protein